MKKKLAASPGGWLQCLRLDPHQIKARKQGSPTIEVGFKQLWNLVQKHGLKINLTKPLLEGPSAVGNDLKHLVDKYMVWGNLGIPCLHEFLDDDGNDTVQLKINVV